MRCKMIATLSILSIALLGASVVDAQDPPRIRCTWDRPDSGSPVVHYELQIKDVDGGLDTTITVSAQPGAEQEYTFEGEYLRRYVARVRGVDAQDREGPWTTYSPVYVFEEDEPMP